MIFMQLATKKKIDGSYQSTTKEMSYIKGAIWRREAASKGQGKWESTYTHVKMP